MTVTRYRPLRTFTRQRGSTLTGLIIGLIVGLGIAVAVALTITKGASPFTDKVAKSGRPADPAPGQALDPNKPMYPNRDAARVANKEVTEKAAARNGTPAAGASSGTSTSAAKPAPDADPLGQVIAGLKDPSESKPANTHAAPVSTIPAAGPAAPAQASTSGNEKTIYYLQAGAFRDMSDAEATRAKLALLGFEAAISDHSNDSGVLHRVRLGPFNQVETMNKARAKLLDSGVDVAIVRNQR
jgi:cell division protein FtsN